MNRFDRALREVRHESRRHEAEALGDAAEVLNYGTVEEANRIIRKIVDCALAGKTRAIRLYMQYVFPEIAMREGPAGRVIDAPTWTPEAVREYERERMGQIGPPKDAEISQAEFQPVTSTEMVCVSR